MVKILGFCFLINIVIIKDLNKIKLNFNYNFEFLKKSQIKIKILTLLYCFISKLK
jgi:hypothetical protein